MLSMMIDEWMMMKRMMYCQIESFVLHGGRLKITSWLYFLCKDGNSNHSKGVRCCTVPHARSWNVFVCWASGAPQPSWGHCRRYNEIYHPSIQQSQKIPPAISKQEKHWMNLVFQQWSYHAWIGGVLANFSALFPELGGITLFVEPSGGSLGKAIKAVSIKLKKASMMYRCPTYCEMRWCWHNVGKISESRHFRW